MILKKFLFYLLLFCLFTSCHKDDEEASAYTQRVNSFIYQFMSYYYLWNDQIPDLNRESETDSKAYFKKLLVKEDRFSSITDDAESLVNSMQGIEKTYGYSLAYLWSDNSRKTILAAVEYVYPGTPAANAGIERGDLIVSLNGQAITEANMSGLISSPGIKIGIKKQKNGEYAETKNIDLKQVSIEQNPVHTTRIFHLPKAKTGYLCYLNYIDHYNFALDTVFAAFKSAGVTELILDLRYNPGGDANAIGHLCSQIAPLSNCRNKDLIIRTRYNNTLTNDFEQAGFDNNIYLTDSLSDYNLGLKRIFILTSDQTYSASEVTLTGLQPYLNVIQIGERTGGKDTGLLLLRPYVMEQDHTVLDPVIGNWAILPIVCEYQNKNGHTAKGGLNPDYEVESFYLPMAPLGSEADPLIAKAIELIDGNVTASAKSKSQISTPRPFHHAASVYDEVKKNVVINQK